jgi:Zn-finger nucleic acid-binding protein
MPPSETEMRKELKEIEKGVWATVEICPQCKDEWIDEKEHDRLLYICSSAKPSTLEAVSQSEYPRN